MLIMDSLDIMPDPCDNRIIRFNNCIQLLSCICHIAACIEPAFRDLAILIDIIADLVFMTTVGCMGAQMNLELANKARQQNFAVQAPRDWYKQGGGNSAFVGGGSSAGAPQGQMMMGRQNQQVHPAVGGWQQQPQMQQQQVQMQMQPQMQMQMQQQQMQMQMQQQPIMAVAQPVQAQQPMAIMAPPGTGPGSMIQIQNPRTGQMMQVQVPPGVQGGQQFQVMM